MKLIADIQELESIFETEGTITEELVKPVTFLLSRVETIEPDTHEGWKDTRDKTNISLKSGTCFTVLVHYKIVQAMWKGYLMQGFAPNTFAAN